jgi:hypothetical protein
MKYNNDNQMNHIIYNNLNNNKNQILTKSINVYNFQNGLNQLNRNQINPENNYNNNFSQRQKKNFNPNIDIFKQNENNKNFSQQNKLNNNDNMKDNISYRNNNNQNKGFKTPGQDMQQPSMSSDSNIGSYKGGFITPGQIINKELNEKKCIYCKEKIDNKKIDVCKKCFKSKIIDEFYSIYLVCLEKLKNPYMIDGNIQLKLKKDENQENFNLDKALEVYNNSYDDDNLSRDNIISELKKKICVLCKEDLKGEGIKLPCNCYLCSKYELNSFLRNIDLCKDFMCSCSKVYNREMLFDLAVLTNDCIEARKNFIKFFNSLLSRVCCNCAKTKNITYYTNDLYSSKDMNTHNKNERSLLKELKHKLCGQCYEKNINIKRIDCKICKRIHYFNNVDLDYSSYFHK